MKTRIETIVSIDLAWKSQNNELVDIILPENTSDYMVTEYDGSETLYIVQNGSLFEYDANDHKFIPTGIISTNQHNNFNHVSKCGFSCSQLFFISIFKGHAD